MSERFGLVVSLVECDTRILRALDVEWWPGWRLVAFGSLEAMIAVRRLYWNDYRPLPTVRYNIASGKDER